MMFRTAMGPAAARALAKTTSSRPQDTGISSNSLPNAVIPIFWTEKRSSAAIMPTWHGPLSAATGEGVAALALAAGFFLATALGGAAGDGGEGACAEAAVTRNDSKQARTTRVMRPRFDSDDTLH